LITTGRTKQVASLSTVELLRRVPIFRLIPESQILFLAGAVKKHQFKRAELMFEAGQRLGFLVIILSGQVRVLMVEDDGKQAVVATLGAWECVGEMGILDGEAQSATVIADTPVDALLLSQDAFLHCIQNNAHLAVAMLRCLVGRLRNANQKIASLAYVSVYGRVAQYLVDNATESETGDLILAKKLSQVEMSQTIGASREMISQALKTFESQSFLQKMESGKFRVNTHILKDRPDLMPGVVLNLNRGNRSVVTAFVPGPYAGKGASLIGT
jgi:CRP-like cAMP-binding protein